MRIALFLAFAALSPGLAAMQQPSASQVQQALQQQPGLADMVRGRIAQSGLTPDQIRARLSASGYPAALLDLLRTECGLRPGKRHRSKRRSIHRVFKTI